MILTSHKTHSFNPTPLFLSLSLSSKSLSVKTSHNNNNNNCYFVKNCKQRNRLYYFSFLFFFYISRKSPFHCQPWLRSSTLLHISLPHLLLLLQPPPYPAHPHLPYPAHHPHSLHLVVMNVTQKKKRNRWRRERGSRGISSFLCWLCFWRFLGNLGWLARLIGGSSVPWRLVGQPMCAMWLMLPSIGSMGSWVCQWSSSLKCPGGLLVLGWYIVIFYWNVNVGFALFLCPLVFRRYNGLCNSWHCEFALFDCWFIALFLFLFLYFFFMQTQWLKLWILVVNWWSLLLFHAFLVCAAQFLEFWISVLNWWFLLLFLLPRCGAGLCNSTLQL